MLIKKSCSPGAHRSWGRIKHGGASTLCIHLKTCFKKDLDQNMLENALFYGEK